ncbi:MAG: hypothetical protein J6L92_02610 [Clostridia bacterium]|nr:hypothetical protein [Clostridia bacterium]
MRISFDEMAQAFFEDESLELSERVGKALVAKAKTMKLSFGKNILPNARVSHHLTKFSSDSSISFETGRLDSIEKEHPELHDEVEYAREKFTGFNMRAGSLQRSSNYNQLSDGAIWGGGWGGHANPDFGAIVNIGTDGVREKIAKYRQINTDDTEGFYRGCELAMEALDILGERFHELAVKMAEECKDEKNKKRYELAAKAFEVIPKKPAYDFTSACHAFWMVFTFDGIDSPGRFDQYMKRAYDLTTDKEELNDILTRLWEEFHNWRVWNLCLSGSDENWNDETNGLTYDILRIAREKLYQTPNITLRVHRNTPEELWQVIADTLATGIGMPALYNDEIVCPAFEKIGIPPCDSHDYCMNGCNQIDIMGKSHMGLEDGEVNFAKALEFALNNGVNTYTNQLIGVVTGDITKFETYEEMENAFMIQLEFLIYMSCLAANSHQQMRATYGPNPYRSCLIEGCIEKGIDYRNGGPLYNHGQILAEGIADTGDSLWAIKKLVFIEKKYTMAQMKEALDAHFIGYDEMYRDFSSCEKFGNDCEEVDNITAKITNRFFTVLKRHHTYRGGVFTGGCSTFSRAADYGRNTGTLPDGHIKGSVLLADCVGAVPGCDTNGPTALIKSVLKYNHIDSGSGFIFQIKLDKKIINTPKGKASMIALAKTFFAGGGQQFTVTVVNPEELIEAQKNPDQYRNLIVRVGGYSDYFVNLEKGLQDNIIARTNIEV